MAKLSVLSWIGNAAAVLFGKHGDVTAQAQQAGCSRQVACEHADRVQQAVALPSNQAPAATVLRQRRDLRRQVKDLQRQLHQERRRDDRVELGRDKQRRAGVPLHARGLSLNQIEDVFALLLPKGHAPDRSTVGHGVRAAPARSSWPTGRATTAAGRRPARVAWKLVADARAWYDGRVAAWQQARQALTLLQPNGPLNDPTQAERAIAAACVGLPGQPWKKVRAFSRTAGR